MIPIRSLLGVKKPLGIKRPSSSQSLTHVRSVLKPGGSSLKVDTRLEVRHLLDALLVDLAVTGLHHLVHLLDQLGLHLGVLRQAEGQGGEGAGGCLKASKDEDDRLAQL